MQRTPCSIRRAAGNNATRTVAPVAPHSAARCSAAAVRRQCAGEQAASALLGDGTEAAPVGARGWLALSTSTMGSCEHSQCYARAPAQMRRMLQSHFATRLLLAEQEEACKARSQRSCGQCHRCTTADDARREAANRGERRWMESFALVCRFPCLFACSLARPAASLNPNPSCTACSAGAPQRMPAGMV
jgi:hypothetical protein